MADSYQLPVPDAGAARRALERALGGARAAVVWSEATASQHVPVEGELTPLQLLGVARAIAERQGIESIVGLSLEVRCETWLALYAREGGRA